MVKSMKFSSDISDENVDNFFSFHPGRDNSCVISISSHSEIAITENISVYPSYGYSPHRLSTVIMTNTWP